MASVPKKDTGVRRVIHDLSFPRGNSVNSHIPRHFCTVSYETIDDCVNIIASLGPGCLIAKGDIKDAFYTCRIQESSYHFLGFHWNSQFYFQKTLPMGASISCKDFELFSCAVQWILIQKLGVKHMSHILDDFMFFGKAGSRDCELSLTKFLKLSDSLGIPIKHEKTVHPSTEVELHGIWFDTVCMKMSVPLDKVVKAQALISNMLQAKKVTLRTLQSLNGLLNFLSRVIKCGRTFLCRLYDVTKGISISTRLVHITREARSDLRAWAVLLHHFNGTRIIKEIDWSAPDWKLFSDASGSGFAGVFGNLWFQGSFPDEWKEKSIAVRELVPVYYAMLLWNENFKSCNVVFNVDNLSVVCVLNTQTSPDHAIMSLLRRIIVIAMLQDINICGVHIPGRHNVIADLLSRFQVAKALAMGPWLRPLPVEIPKRMMLW